VSFFSFLLFGSVVAVSGLFAVFFWPRVGKLTVPLILLFFLAVTGETDHARSLVYIMIKWRGDVQSGMGPWWGLWEYVSGLLPFGLLMWLGWEIDRRFPVRGSPPRPRCGKCGYDLTGNTSGTCPECGTPSKHVQGTADERQ